MVRGPLPSFDGSLSWMWTLRGLCMESASDFSRCAHYVRRTSPSPHARATVHWCGGLRRFSRGDILAIARLESFFPDGEEFEAEVHDQIEFIDPGEIIDAVICPACNKHLNLDPVAENDPVAAWWYELADAMSESPVETVTTRMPCCGRIARVLDLEFDWPAGFAKFELSVMNPNSADNLAAWQLLELEMVLGCPLKQVRAHY